MLMLFLQAGLISVILIVFYRFMETNSDYEIDWWMAFVFALAPRVLITVLAIGFGIFDLPMEILPVSFLLYFIIPFLILKKGLYFDGKTAFKFAIAVPFAAVASEIPFLFWFTPLA